MPIHITDELDEREQLDIKVDEKAQQVAAFPPAVLDLLLEHVSHILTGSVPHHTFSHVLRERSGCLQESSIELIAQYIQLELLMHEECQVQKMIGLKCYCKRVLNPSPVKRRGTPGVLLETKHFWVVIYQTKVILHISKLWLALRFCDSSALKKRNGEPRTQSEKS